MARRRKKHRNTHKNIREQTVSKLVTPEGKILVPGLSDLVAPLTEEERKRYEVIKFGIEVSWRGGSTSWWMSSRSCVSEE